MGDSTQWECLPEPILISILSLLPIRDRCSASLVCSTWNNAFQSSQLWYQVHLKFVTPAHIRYIQMIKNYGRSIRDLRIDVLQSEPFNREAACQFIDHLSREQVRRLQRISIRFIGVNPLFYRGQEFLDVLTRLFSFNYFALPQSDDMQPPIPKRLRSDLPEKLLDAPATSVGYTPATMALKEIDLNQLAVTLTADLIDTISANCSNLQVPRIRNSSLVCKIYPNCTKRLVTRCKKLNTLEIFHIALDNDVFECLIDQPRGFRFMHIHCSRQEKYTQDISADVWERFVQSNPDLRVTFTFDKSCLLHKIAQTVKPMIPVVELRMPTYMDIAAEINLAAALYHNTLEKLVADPQPTPELEAAIGHVSEKCHKLRSIHIFCRLSQTTIQKVLEEHPILLQRRSFTLRSLVPNGAWVAGNDC